MKLFIGLSAVAAVAATVGLTMTTPTVGEYMGSHQVTVIDPVPQSTEPVVQITTLVPPQSTAPATKPKPATGKPVTSKPTKVTGAVVESLPTKPVAKPNRSVVKRRIEVNVTEQRLRAYENDNLVMEFLCSTASTGIIVGTDTNPEDPHDHVGDDFTILDKDRDKFSNTYQVPMPYALHYFGGHYIHATDEVAKLGQRASHGCVRLSIEDARQLFDWARVNDRIIIH